MSHLSNERHLELLDYQTGNILLILLHKAQMFGQMVGSGTSPPKVSYDSLTSLRADLKMEKNFTNSHGKEIGKGHLCGKKRWWVVVVLKFSSSSRNILAQSVELNPFPIALWVWKEQVSRVPSLHCSSYLLSLNFGSPEFGLN